MEQQMKLLRQETKAYHQEAALLVQFILSELFAAHAEIEKLKGSAPVPDEALGALAGNRKREGMLFKWLSEDGILEKMHHFCCCYVQESPAEDKGARTMQRTVNQAWLLALQAQAEGRLAEEYSGDYNVKPLLEKLLTAFDRAAKQVWKVLERYQQDDNVLFFTLRHHSELDTVYGAGTTRKLLRKGFRSLSDAGQWLQIRYGKRGFNQLLPVIEEKMAEIGTES